MSDKNQRGKVVDKSILKKLEERQKAAKEKLIASKKKIGEMDSEILSQLVGSQPNKVVVKRDHKIDDNVRSMVIEAAQQKIQALGAEEELGEDCIEEFNEDMARHLEALQSCRVNESLINTATARWTSALNNMKEGCWEKVCLKSLMAIVEKAEKEITLAANEPTKDGENGVDDAAFVRLKEIRQEIRAIEDSLQNRRKRIATIKKCNTVLEKWEEEGPPEWRAQRINRSLINAFAELRKEPGDNATDELVCKVHEHVSMMLRDDIEETEKEKHREGFEALCKKSDHHESRKNDKLKAFWSQFDKALQGVKRVIRNGKGQQKAVKDEDEKVEKITEVTSSKMPLDASTVKGQRFAGDWELVWDKDAKRLVAKGNYHKRIGSIKPTKDREVIAKNESVLVDYQLQQKGKQRQAAKDQAEAQAKALLASLGGSGGTSGDGNTDVGGNAGGTPNVTDEDSSVIGGSDLGASGSNDGGGGGNDGAAANTFDRVMDQLRVVSEMLPELLAEDNGADPLELAIFGIDDADYEYFNQFTMTLPPVYAEDIDEPILNEDGDGGLLELAGTARVARMGRSAAAGVEAVVASIYEEAIDSVDAESLADDTIVAGLRSNFLATIMTKRNSYYVDGVLKEKKWRYQARHEDNQNPSCAVYKSHYNAWQSVAHSDPFRTTLREMLESLLEHPYNGFERIRGLVLSLDVPEDVVSAYEGLNASTQALTLDLASDIFYSLMTERGNKYKFLFNLFFDNQPTSGKKAQDLAIIGALQSALQEASKATEDAGKSDAEMMEEIEELFDAPKSYPFKIYEKNSFNIGLQFVYEQRWKHLSNQRGEVVKTIPMGPRQEEKVKIKVVRREKYTNSFESNKERETDIQTSQTTKDSREIIKEAAENFGVDASVEGSGNVLGFFDIKTSVGTNYENKQNTRNTSNRLSESMQKSATKTKNATKVAINIEKESEFERESSSAIYNPNDEMALTYWYSKLERLYNVVTELYDVKPIIYFAEPMPDPNEINDKWIRTHAPVIASVLMDESLRSALEEIVSTGAEESALSQEMSKRFREWSDTGYTTLTGVGNGLTGDLSGVDFSSKAQEGYANAHEAFIAKIKARREYLMRVVRLKVHIIENILHYMKAIWSSERLDARALRYDKINAVVPLTWRMESSLDVDIGSINDAGELYALIQGLERGAADITFTPGNQEGEEGGLENALISQVVNSLQPSWIHGNLVAYELDLNAIAGSDLETVYNVLLSDYLEANEEYAAVANVPDNLAFQVVDPTYQDYMEAFAANDLTTEQKQSIDDRIKHEMIMLIPELKLIALGIYINEGDNSLSAYEFINATSTIKQILDKAWGGADADGNGRNNPYYEYYGRYMFLKNESKRVVVDTDNVILDIKRGKGSTLEPYKNLSRGVDVIKSISEIEVMKVQNEKRLTHIDDPSFIDPIVSTKVIVADRNVSVSSE